MSIRDVDIYFNLERFFSLVLNMSLNDTNKFSLIVDLSASSFFVPALLSAQHEHSMN